MDNKDDKFEVSNNKVNNDNDEFYDAIEDEKQIVELIKQRVFHFSNDEVSTTDKDNYNAVNKINITYNTDNPEKYDEHEKYESNEKHDNNNNSVEIIENDEEKLNALYNLYENQNKSKLSNSKLSSNTKIINELEKEIIYRNLQAKSKSIKQENLNLNINLLKTYLGPIHVSSKLNNRKASHFINLFEIQNFQADYQELWCTKLNCNGKYLATGGKSCILKIWELIEYDFSLQLNKNIKPKDLLNSIHLIKETAYREYLDHVDDIIDISWSHNNPHILITASLDNYVIVWDISKTEALLKINHNSMVSCIDFNPNSDKDIFVSGSFDKYIRIYSIDNTNVIDYTNIPDYITAITYDPTGEYITAGTNEGKCKVFSVNPKLKYIYSFEVRNHSGKFSDGRKVTNFEYINKNEAIITTNDSSIRLVQMKDGKVLQKYKGCTNLELIMKGHYEEIYDLVISSSENDGYVYVWKKFCNDKNNKNSESESFKPFLNDKVSNSFFLCEEALINYTNRIKQLSNKIYVCSILINSSLGGKLQVLINVINL